MTNRTIGFVGGGRVARIFLEGWKRGGALPAKIVVSDCNAEAIAKLEAHFPGIEAAPGKSAAAGSQQVIAVSLGPTRP